MKPRARRVTLGVALAGFGVLAVFVVLNWSTIRDHLEAWHLQLMHETESTDPRTVSPLLREVGQMRRVGNVPYEVLFYSTYRASQILAMHSRLPVVFSTEWHDDVVLASGRLYELADEAAVVEVRRVLEKHGYRVIEQRFPRRAYVVIRDAPPKYVAYPDDQSAPGEDEP